MQLFGCIQWGTFGTLNAETNQTVEVVSVRWLSQKE